jgi:uncharacterized protein YkwD
MKNLSIIFIIFYSSISLAYSQKDTLCEYEEYIQSLDIPLLVSTNKPNNLETIFINDLNKYRISLGLPILEYNSELSVACLIQSEYIYLFNIEITHFNKHIDYLKKPSKRLCYVQSKIKNWRIDAQSEIIGGASNEYMVDGFKTSPYHHLAMVDRDITKIGICMKNGITVVVFGYDNYISTEERNRINSKYPLYTIDSKFIQEAEISYHRKLEDVGAIQTYYIIESAKKTYHYNITIKINKNNDLIVSNGKKTIIVKIDDLLKISKNKVYDLFAKYIINEIEKK